jgi:hypothetical protein
VGNEARIRQRDIVGRRLLFADSELMTKYTLPFVDATWKVPFVVLDVLGRPPAILEDSIHLNGLRLRTNAPVRALRTIESMPVSAFSGFVHYDPWWAFRGVSGVNRTWVKAIFATNVARPFRHEGRTLKIHDLVFADGLRHLETVVAKDDYFRAETFGAGDLDLLALRSGTRTERPSSRESSAAKAL